MFINAKNKNAGASRFILFIIKSSALFTFFILDKKRNPVIAKNISTPNEPKLSYIGIILYGMFWFVIPIVGK
ncbi:hypothetical protein VEE68_33630 [Escherichia coli]|nr:hypothetical protein VEGS12_30960 [Escherichia coli]BDZ88916.1 hypothetical protein VEE68_33630 [Escherichia coli]